MKKIFAFIIMLTVSNLIAQSNDTINKFNSKKQKIGKWITYEEFEGDSLKRITFYKNGIIDGFIYTYFPNNKVHSIVSYKNGLQHGKSKYYYKDGVISDIFISEKGISIFHLKFDTTGKIFQESDSKKKIQYIDGKPQ
jgi:antitoxin component YwqK of YwqJK toxin-antitoxin module